VPDDESDSYYKSAAVAADSADSKAPESKPAAEAAVEAAYSKHYVVHKPKAAVCSRCMMEDGTVEGLSTPHRGTADPKECGCAKGHGGEKCEPCKAVSSPALNQQ